MTNRAEWNTYRTRFLIRARQLTEPLVFVDGLGREHRGSPGDYLVESCDGWRRITPRNIFEDVYVSMVPDPAWGSLRHHRVAELSRPQNPAVRIPSALTT